jgi:RNA polymerase sigma-70 factor (ECF subfamily)
MLTRTTTALLEDLADPANEAVWREFDQRYRPILIALGRRLGLAPEDAADAAQEALVRFVAAYRGGSYDRSRGRLHSWLTGIARHCILDLRHAAGTRQPRRGLSAIEALPDEPAMSEMWEEETARHILRFAVGRLRDETDTKPDTIRAFELLAFHDRSPRDVADELGMSMNDVYLAKHRCLKHMRTFVTELNEAYEIPA